MVNKAHPMRIGVIGSGSWATALVKLFSNNQSHVNWWVRSEESIAHIQAYKHNPRYLQSAELEVTKLRLSTSLQEVISSSDYLIDLNAETIAKINNELHKIQLVQAIVKYNSILGN